MKRDILALETRRFDVIIVGGGIYGAVLTWQLTVSGYKVLLLEKGDFCSATSANSLKILHGGLRYLQHLDLRRMRESIVSRRELMRFCPHLTRPLGCLVPTVGHGLRSKGIMATAFLINDLISWDRNRNLPPENRLPRGRLVRKKNFVSLLPDLPQEEVTGGALWFDGLALNTERLALEYILAAVDLDAVAINYFQVDRIVSRRVQGQLRVRGVEGRDVHTGRTCHIDAPWVINAAGPWYEHLLRISGLSAPVQGSWAKAVNLVVRKQLHPEFGVGLESREEYLDRDAMFKRGKRLYFFVPWRRGSMIGTTYRVYPDHPDRLKATEEDIAEILEEVNQIYPRIHLERKDVSFFHCGLVPMAGSPDDGPGEVQLAKSSLILEHGRHGGPAGLISLRTIKYTTAPAVAEKVAAIMERRRAGKSGKPVSFFPRSHASTSVVASKPVVRHLRKQYGNRADRILAFAASRGIDETWLHRDPDVLTAEIHYFVQEEMAVTLADIVFRRTGLGSFGCPSLSLLERIAAVMAAELSWDAGQVCREIQRVQVAYVPESAE